MYGSAPGGFSKQVRWRYSNIPNTVSLLTAQLGTALLEEGDPMFGVKAGVWMGQPTFWMKSSQV